MLALGIDTCLDACAVALMRGDSVLAESRVPVTRAHVEHLSPMVARLLADAGIRAGALERIGATVGPGSFTGARVGVAFARGLSLATGAPAIGITTLSALAATGHDGDCAVLLDARRGEVYAQAFRSSVASGPATAVPRDALHAWLTDRRVAHILSPSDEVLAWCREIDGITALPAQLMASTIARLAIATPPDAALRLAPLYLRAPDAKLPGAA